MLRWLSIEEQAKFSIAFSLQTLLLTLSDLGVTGSITALTGNRVYDKNVLGAYIQAAKKLRNYFFIAGCLVTLSIAPFMAHIQVWSYFELFILLIPILLSIYWEINSSYYWTTLILYKKMNDFFKPQIGVTCFKLISNYLLFLSGFISSFTTLAINSISYFFLGHIFRKKAQPYFELNENYKTETKEMIQYLKPIILSTVFFAFQGQIQIFIISFFGNINNIAEVAALGRLGQVFLFFNAANGLIAFPIIAKSTEKELFKKFMLVLGITLLVAASIFSFALIFPQVLLFLLGPKYYHLKNELGIMVFNSCLVYIAGVFYGMNSSRKWVFWGLTWTNLIGMVLCEIIGVLVFDVSTTQGVLYMAVLAQLFSVAVCGITSIIGFVKIKSQKFEENVVFANANL